MTKHNSPHDSDRGRRAENIIANPSGFKVCEGCESIVARSASLCANCNAYRFDESEGRVVEQARYLAGRARQSVIAEDLD